jgi:FAD/FMN-containing dehydrogenase/Fe-S oxidoreductase
MVAIRLLEESLRRSIRGEVRFDAGAKAAYAADASNYRQIPIAVVLPRGADDIVAAVSACRAHGAPLLARGGGTSLCGQAVNAAVVLDCSKYMDRVLAIDSQSRLASVEPGAVCDTLRNAAEAHGLTFAPDPATHSRCTLGGMIGNNSCGPHSVMAGKTVENIERLEVLTYDGTRFWCGSTSEQEFQKIVSEGGRRAEIYQRLRAIAEGYGDLIREKFPKIKRRVSGYNLDQLLPENGFNMARALVGTEGTCAVTLQAEARLVTSPPKRVLVVAGFPDIFAAGDAVPEVLACGPIACEGLDDQIIEGLRSRGLRLVDLALLPQGKGWLMVEFGADTLAEARERARVFQGKFPGLLIEDPVLASRFWAIRETGASATALNLGGRGTDPVVGWEDAAVDPWRLGDYLREFRALVGRFGYRTSLYGHFGDGCIHARIDFELRTPAGVAHWRGFLPEAAALVVKYGGSLSGEHGDGQARAEFLPLMYGPELMQAFREFKAVWDPANRMNPGKLIDAYPVDANLRLGPQYKPVSLKTRFAFASEVGDGFVRATEHCIGMGKCRSASGGTMCPSYRATREERYSTRGRSRLLSEMLRGEVITGGWQSEEVKEALEWCLGCKGCRSDCPTHTDMAAYKAEFMSHYYEQHRRPRQAHTMGRIGEWAPLAAKMPGLVNFLSSYTKRVAGIAPQRRAPQFAARPFRSQFRPGSQGGEPVILLDDTFNNHFRPATARAAQQVLEAAGCAVELPRERVCCGRPYYDYGMLDRAKATLERALQVLGPRLDAGVPLVVLEPGCLSVFRDELKQLFPADARAAQVARSAGSLPELLAEKGATLKSSGRYIMHGHCHQKALWGTGADLAVLRGAGCEVIAPDTGCCGMAGSFGYRPEFHEASMRLGASVMDELNSDPDAKIVANGFSCREQIEDLSGRETLHIAEVLVHASR